MADFTLGEETATQKKNICVKETVWKQCELDIPLNGCISLLALL